MSEKDNQVPSALVRVGGRTLAVRSATLVKRGLALAKSLQPGDAAAHDTLGVALGDNGDLDGAIAEFRTAISPDFSPDFVAFMGRSEGRGFNPAEDAAANSLFVSRPEPLERTNCSGREMRG
jgi:hypothetical protein